MERPPPLEPISSVNILLHGAANTDSKAKPLPPPSLQRNDSPMAQVRSYVEKQMDQLQQDLEFGFSRTSKAPASPSPATTILPSTSAPVGMILPE
jgi:hypothetical protein